MKANKKSRIIFVEEIIIALTSVIALIFFALSYTTGYIGIVFGENNSVTILITILVTLAVAVFSLILAAKGVERDSIALEIGGIIQTATLTLSLLLLFVDRVEALANCIIAPWDAGHGGEDSFYISCVSMACFLIALVCNLVVSFKGGSKPARKKRVKTKEQKNG